MVLKKSENVYKKSQSNHLVTVKKVDHWTLRGKVDFPELSACAGKPCFYCEVYRTIDCATTSIVLLNSKSLLKLIFFPFFFQLQNWIHIIWGFRGMWTCKTPKVHEPQIKQTISVECFERKLMHSISALHT